MDKLTKKFAKAIVDSYGNQDQRHVTCNHCFSEWEAFNEDWLRMDWNETHKPGCIVIDAKHIVDGDKP